MPPPGYQREELGGFPRVDLVEGDFIELDLAELAASHDIARLTVVGNIPYHITAPILRRVEEKTAQPLIDLILDQARS